MFFSPSARADDFVVLVVCWPPPRRSLRLRRAYGLGGIEMAFAFVWVSCIRSMIAVMNVFMLVTTRGKLMFNLFHCLRGKEKETQ